MFTRILSTCLLLLAITCAAQNSAPAPNLDIPKGMKQYFIGFLVKGEKYDPHMPKPEHEKLLQEHLAYIRSQAEAGKYKLAGPFLDEGNISGILIIDTPSRDEAKQIVSKDPMVQAGRLAIELHPAMLADVSCVLMVYQKSSGK
jgi:uncharacterized protein YciI